MPEPNNYFKEINYKGRAMGIKFRLWVAGMFLILACVSCSTTQLVERWHDPDFNGPKLQKFLVLGLFKNDSRRRAFEQTFSERINASGRAAVPGYSLVPDPADIESKQAVVAAIKKAGADAVLITHFRGITEKERQVPPRVEYYPARRHGYYHYYAPVYHRVYHPGYTVTDSIVKLETQVYTLRDEQLVWAGNSESVNSSSAEKIVQELVGLVVADMQKSGLID